MINLICKKDLLFQEIPINNICDLICEKGPTMHALLNISSNNFVHI